MDAKGARLLRARIAAGAIPGARIEVVSVEDGHPTALVGAHGTVLSFGEAGVRIAFDSGETLVVDPLGVRLRVLRRPA